MHNPFGSGCGTSIVVTPSAHQASLRRLGTRGARLSDTATGKAPKRPRTSEELSSMARHPAGKARNRTLEASVRDGKSRLFPNGSTISLFDRLSIEIAVYGSGT